MGLKLYTFKVLAGGEEIPALTGDYIRVEKANVPIRLRTENGDDFTLDEGEEANIGQFQRLIIGHEGVGEETIRLFVGDNGARVGSAKVSGLVDVNGWVKAANLAGAVSTQYDIGTASQLIMGYSANRRAVKVKNLSSIGTVYLRFATGNFAATPSNSWPLGPGEELDIGFANTGYCMAIADTPSVKLAVIEGIGS